MEVLPEANFRAVNALASEDRLQIYSDLRSVSLALSDQLAHAVTGDDAQDYPCRIHHRQS
jgi:hypothetical protein